MVRDKPDSVRVETRDGYIPRMIVANHLVQLSEHYSTSNITRRTVVLGTALHRGKDLAVSPGTLPYQLLPNGSPLAFASGVSARTSVITHDGGYPLPVCTVVLPYLCPDFPHSSMSNYITELRNHLRE